MLKKFCSCGKIILQSEDMCNACREKYSIDKKKSYMNYKKRRTDDKEQNFYCSVNWKITRDSIRLRDKGVCRLCNDKNKHGLIDHVHHIVELKENWQLRTTQSNLIGLCNRCHYYVHKVYNQNETRKKEMQEELKKIIEG